MIIGSTASSGCWMLLCVDISEGWDGCRPAFSLATSMRGNHTQYVRGGCRSLLGCWYQSLPACWCRSVSYCLCWSISFVLTRNGIGGYGCRLVKTECHSIRNVSHDPLILQVVSVGAQLVVSIDTNEHCRWTWSFRRESLLLEDFLPSPLARNQHLWWHSRGVSFSFSQRFLLLNNFSCLNHLSLQFLHMCA